MAWLSFLPPSAPFNRSLARTLAALVLCLGLGGCAGYFELFRSENTAPPFRDQTLSMPAVTKLITAGKTSKADVLATLGEAKVITFDSGFEVWVYKGRYAADVSAQGEFVVLFDPAGVVRKFRVRGPQKGA